MLCLFFVDCMFDMLLELDVVGGLMCRVIVIFLLVDLDFDVREFVVVFGGSRMVVCMIVL